MKGLIPYATLPGTISMEVREARLDNTPLHLGMISNGLRVVALHQVDYGHWDEATLTVRLRAPQLELDTGQWSDAVCLAVLAERRTQTRTATRLTREAEGVWGGTVRLHRDHHLGHVELVGQVIATVDGVPGRLIGLTESRWTIDLKAKTPAKKNAIKMVAVDFGDEANPHLHPYKMDPWTIEVAEEEPIVYLNAGFEGLVPLLNSGDRAVRDALSAQIATDVWMALLNAAVYAVQTEDGAPQWPGGWKDSVLKRMLPDMFPDRSPDDALIEVVTRSRHGEGSGEDRKSVV